MFGVTLCGAISVEVDGRRLPDSLLAGRQGRLVLAYLVCERHRSVARDELAELLWGENLPDSWSASLSAVISKLRRLLGEGGLNPASTLASAFGSYRLHLPEEAVVDWEIAARAVERAEQAADEGNRETALAAAGETRAIARRGFHVDDCEWVDARRQQLRHLHVRAVDAQTRAHLSAGEPGRAVIAARELLELDDAREASYRLLMEALVQAGERGEALRVWEHCRTMLAEELGVDPSPETESVYLSILADQPPPPVDQPEPVALPTGVVTFLLTDIVDSTGLWERHPAAMAIALERHERIVGSSVAAQGGVVLKSKLEGDATVSVFPRASAGAAAAVALRAALLAEEWPDEAQVTVRMGLHMGEAIERDSDFFGPAVNRAARIRGLAAGGQILVSRAVAEVIADQLPDDTVLRSRGEYHLRGSARAEHVYELIDAALATADDTPSVVLEKRPPFPLVLDSRSVFVGRANEFERLSTEWATAATGTARAVLVAGEPGVGKTRLASEFARSVFEEGGLVLYGRCDEELGAPYQPFAEALGTLLPYLRSPWLRSLRGVEDLARLVPDVRETVKDLAEPTQADPNTERFLLFDALARLLAGVSAEAPVLLVVDDLHWAAKPTLLLLRHLLRSAEGNRMLIVGTYRSTDLTRSQPLAASLGDLQADGSTERISLGGLDSGQVSEYVAAAGYDDERLGPALSTVTAGNPFFLIEVLRHVGESGGHWDPSSLPQGVREAVTRRLARLSDLADEALLTAAVAGSRFSLGLLEQVSGRDLVDALDEARRAGLVVEETGGWFRFEHALVRQCLLAELASVKRVRLHQHIAAALEADPSLSGESLLADLARHFFECAYAGSAAKAVDYSRRAAEAAMSRLAYEEASVLYDQAVQAAEIDHSGITPEGRADLLLARCESLLAARDPAAVAPLLSDLSRIDLVSPRLSAWRACYEAQMAVLTQPDRLDATAERAAGVAEQFAAVGDAVGEAEAYGVLATCSARLGRVADCEAALDRALVAARRSGDPRQVNAVLASAPMAVLWGPSPVPRASGRCLDVVRVVRITTGSPAVEAVALRCQAVLEAARGRAEPARRMIDSARSTLDSLGHQHALLETDLYAGIVELCAGAPSDAEVALRRAFDGFTRRGVGVDAAQSAALLARAVLAQGRVSEALALTDAAKDSAGADLKAAIAWRAARAEALAQTGDLADAVDHARTAVSLADATDALLDRGDAHLSLGVVLHAGGEVEAADAEVNQAIDLYERKGADAYAEVARRMLAVSRAHAPAPHSDFATSPAPSATPDSRRRVRRNAAVECVEEGFRRLRNGDYVGFASLFSDESVWTDHRVHLTAGLNYLLQPAKALVSKEIRDFEFEVLASLGERHVLTRAVYRHEGSGLAEGHRTGPVEAVFLQLNRVDSAGLCTAGEWFDPDDLNLALARLIEFHAQDELPPARRPERDEFAAWNRALQSKWSEDAVLVDHRPASLGTLRGRDAINDAAAALRNLSADMSWRIVDVLAFEERGGLMEILSEGHSDDGGLAQMSLVALAVCDDDGFIERAEWYLPEQLEEAFARFDELQGPRPGPGGVAPDRFEVTNLAHQVAAKCVRALEGHDWDTVGGLMRPDAVFDDRRRVVGGVRFEGRDVMVEGFQVVAALGVGNVPFEVLATRGDYLVLARTTFQGAGFEIPALSLVDIDVDGLYRTDVFFDASDLDAAFEELDHLYLAGDGAGGKAFERVAAAARERFSSRRVVAVLRDTVWGAAIVLRGPHHDQIAVGTVHDRGQVTLELLPISDREDALARIDGISANRLQVTNLAYRAAANYARAIAEHDFDAIFALTHPDVVFDDRRRITGVGFEGRDAMVEAIRVIASLGVSGVAIEPLASRGEHLALIRVLYEGDGFELAVLSQVEVDGNGLWRSNTYFDDDDLDSAFQELDRLYLDGEGAAEKTFGSVAAATKDCYPDSQVIAVLRDTPSGAVVVVRHSDRDQIVVGNLGHQGSVSLEVFPLSEEAAALASLEVSGQGGFDSSDSAQGVTSEVALPEVLRERAEILTSGFRSGDWTRFSSRCGDGFYMDDRRRVIGGLRYEGPQDAIAYLEFWRKRGMREVVDTLIASRGKRLWLFEELWRGPDVDGAAIVVLETDPEERYCALVIFELDERDAAYAELDRRYAAGEAAPYAKTLRVTGRWAAAYLAEDWETVLSLLSPDCVTSYRLPIKVFPDMDRELFVEQLRVIRSQMSHDEFRIVSIPRLTEAGMVMVVVITGRNEFGGEVDYPGAWVALVDSTDPLISRLEMYDVDVLDSALARFDDLTAPKGPVEEVMARLNRALHTGDWEPYAALLHPEIVMEDRRRVIGGGRITSGIEPCLAEGKSIAELAAYAGDPVSVSATPIATRGDRLWLLRQAWGSASSNVGLLCVCEAHPDGRWQALMFFDEDDFDAAYDELDTRYAAGEAAAHHQSWDLARRYVAAIHARDMEAEAALLAPNLVVRDHRRMATFPELDRHVYLEQGRVMLEQIPDRTLRILNVPRLADDAGVFVIEIVGHDALGGAVSLPGAFVALRDPITRLIGTLELFEPDDTDVACARFDELTAPCAGTLPAASSNPTPA